MTARAKADDDAPSSAGPPSYEAPPSYDADVRIPAPPILPTPASMGMASLGLPPPSARAIARAPASEVRELRPRVSGDRSPIGGGRGRFGVRIGIGIGIGVVLSLAVVLVYLLRP